MKVLRVASALSIAVLSSVGCAGPMTPFGALDLAQSKAASVEESLALSKHVPTIRFTPQRQVLHGPATFSVIVEDPNGVSEDFRLLVSYNGLDITREFLRHSR